MAAAVGLAAQVPTGLPVAQPSAHHTAAAGTSSQAGATHARLTSVTRPANGEEQGQQASYTVRSGDTLSAIAGRFYQNPANWPVIYRANSGKIPSADELVPGEVLNIPANTGQMPSTSAGLKPSSENAPQSAAPADSSGSASSTASTGGTPGGAFGQCVVSHESGGNAQVMNSSGHYGLYQFSPSTWAAYGGNPADFGHASVAEQNQVFSNALAQGGQSNWSQYDGC